MYLHKYLQFLTDIILLCFVFLPYFRCFLRFYGLFVSFSLVYTRIIEQKRIAGQVQNVFIFKIFKIF